MSRAQPPRCARARAGDLLRSLEQGFFHTALLLTMNCNGSEQPAKLQAKSVILSHIIELFTPQCCQFTPAEIYAK